MSGRVSGAASPGSPPRPCRFLLLAAVLLAPAVSAPALLDVPRSAYSVGPSLGYVVADSLSGFTLGFDAARTWYEFSGSLGARFVFSRADGPAFAGNRGLVIAYAELAFTCVGIGASWNFALGAGNGPGIHAYFSLPVPVGPNENLALFYKPSWTRIGGRRELLNEWGVYWKFTNFSRRSELETDERTRESLERRQRELKEGKVRDKNDEDKLFEEM